MVSLRSIGLADLFLIVDYFCVLFVLSVVFVVCAVLLFVLMFVMVFNVLFFLLRDHGVSLRLVCQS